MIHVHGTITEEGDVILTNFLTCLGIFKARGLIGSEVILSIEKYRKKRSDRQNRYVWGVVVPIIQKWMKDTQGELISKDEAYMYIRVGILGDKPVVREVAGIQVVTLESKRLSQRNTAEFAEAVEIIVRVMAERGCPIPLPREENLLTDFI